MEQPKRIDESLTRAAGDLVDFPAGGRPTDETAEAITAELIRSARLRRAREFYERVCPPAYRASDWSHPSLAPNLEAIRRVLEWQFGPKGLLLSGVARTGKTRSVWALLRRLLVDEGRRVAVYHAQDLVGRIAEEMRFGRDDAGAFIDALADMELLFIDDLGQQGAAASNDERVAAWLLRLIDRRLAEQRPLLVTTNVGAVGLALGRGDRSRLRHEPLVGRLVEFCSVVRFIDSL